MSDKNIINDSPEYNLESFRELVNGLDDMELLDAAEDLMTDLATINNLKQRVEMLEKDLHVGKRAAFYFFAMELDKEAVAMATQTVKGRKRVLNEKAKRLEEAKAEAETKDSAE